MEELKELFERGKCLARDAAHLVKDLLLLVPDVVRVFKALAKGAFVKVKELLP